MPVLSAPGGCREVAKLSLLFGLSFVAFGLWMRARRQASQAWPSVEGAIVESRIDGFDLDSQSPWLAYTDTVNGREFRGNRVSFSGHGTSKAAMEAILRPYPLGRVVRVHFAPLSLELRAGKRPVEGLVALVGRRRGLYGRFVPFAGRGLAPLLYNQVCKRLSRPTSRN